MGWGFRRRAGLFGGLLRLNFSKRGLGASVGAPGLRVGLNSVGHPYLRGGVPGTGLSVSESLTHRKTAGRKPAHALTYLACAVFVALWTVAVWVLTFHPVR